MRHVSYIVAAAALAGALGGCANPYYPRSGYSQSYYQQPSYGYYQQPSYGYYQQPGYSYSQPSYAYRSSAWDRNYKGIHPGPEQTYP